MWFGDEVRSSDVIDDPLKAARERCEGKMEVDCGAHAS